MKGVINSIFILFFIAKVSFCQETSTRHPIDIACEKCLDVNFSTAGMNQCMKIATDSWNQELNKYFNLLSEQLSKEQFKQLQEAQNSWIIYRDKELDFSINLFYSMQGTMWTNVAANKKMEIIKARAVELTSLYSLINLEEE